MSQAGKPNEVVPFALSTRTVKKAVASGDKGPAAARERRNSIDNAILPLEGDELVAEIGKLWDETQQKFLAIGRYLVRAFDLYHGNFEETVLARLPFGRIVAYQLRAVAEAVDSEKLPEGRLPRSYATAYKLVSLPALDYEEAKKRGIVRTDVTRPEVEAFKRQLREERLQALNRTEFLRQERAHLRAEIARMEDRLQDAQARLSDIADEIGNDVEEDGPILKGAAIDDGDREE
jgi:hypothetical protein